MITETIMWLTLLGIGLIWIFAFLWIMHWIARFVGFGIKFFLGPIIEIMRRT